MPGQLVYLQEVQSQTWLVGIMLGDHPARNGLIFLALTHGACHYTDPGDDACEVTNFEDDVPSVVPPGSFEPFA